MSKVTDLIHQGRKGEYANGSVNTPIYQTSTILFDSLDDLEQADIKYGRHGTQTVFQLCDIIANLEHAHQSFLVPSGLAATTNSLLALVAKDDHVLLSNSLYGPNQSFVTNFLKKFGVSFSFYNPENSQQLEELVRENTKLIFAEAPGSIFFSIDDLDFIVAFAKKHKLISLIDNTWSAGYLFQPLKLGFDISIQSCSKYISGHSDLLLGAISVAEGVSVKIREALGYLGNYVSPHDCYLAARGIRTLTARLAMHAKSGLQIAEFLEQHDLVEKVFYPALKTHNSHELFLKYFKDAHGLLSFYFKKHVSEKQIRSFINNLSLFKIGYSWGGYESLVMLYTKKDGIELEHSNDHIIRIHVGLEDVEDLEQDLTRTLAKI